MNVMQLCKNFRNFFEEAIQALGVSDSFIIPNYSHSDPVSHDIRNYENHSSEKKIRETIAVT